MKVLVTGASGQLGKELLRKAPNAYQVIGLTRQQLDITDSKAVITTVKNYKPDVIINSAAYTAVDNAEDQAQLAFAVNAEGVANLARVAQQQKIRLIHISTDFVFNGRKSTPYLPKDHADPLNVYGRSKWEGEKLASDLTRGEAIILRTGWLYSAYGNNAIRTFLQLMQQGKALKMVQDQIGTPTWAKNLAAAIWQITQQPTVKGIYHYSDAGYASWYEVALALQEIAFNLRLLNKKTSIQPIPMADFPLRAQRPLYCVLDKTTTCDIFKLKLEDWQDALGQMIEELANG